MIVGRHFDPEIRRILDVARETAPKLKDNTVWVTGGWRPGEGKHSSGEAFDIRVKNVEGFNLVTFEYNETVAKWARDMQKLLGSDYDVIYGAPKHLNHIHCEYDPKEEISIILNAAR